ncbi:MAG: hypothetical protein R3C11_17065 [Planctomycetaceae bacterium]
MSSSRFADEPELPDIEMARTSICLSLGDRHYATGKPQSMH